MTDAPICIDLFCGIGGWAEGFLRLGYRVIGFDIRRLPYPGELVLEDVAYLDGSKFSRARVIVASPPCTEFSTMAAWHGHRNPDRAMRLVRESLRIIRESEVSQWCIENSRDSVATISKDLGPPRLRKHSFYLWGEFPDFLLPTSNRLGKGLSKIALPPKIAYSDSSIPFQRSRVDRHASDKFGKIPLALSMALARACL